MANQSLFLLALIPLAAMALIGIPAIMANIKIQAGLEFTKIVIESDPRLDQEFFRAMDKFASRNGFMRELDVSVIGLSGENFNRLYANADGTGLLATQMFAQEGQVTKYIEFLARFDQVSVTVNNAQVSGLFAQPPWVHTIQKPEITDPERLYAIHRQAVPRYGRGSMQRVSGENFGEVFQAIHIKSLDYQGEQGLLRRSSDGQHYSPSLKMALKGIYNYLNPAKDNFTWDRFAKGYVGGVMATGAGWAAYLDGAHWARAAGLEAGPEQMALATAAALGLSYVIGGAVTGYHFEGKGFVWSILALIPAFLLLSATGMVRPEMEHIYLLPGALFIRGANAVNVLLHQPDNRAHAYGHALELAAILALFTYLYGAGA